MQDEKLLKINKWRSRKQSHQETWAKELLGEQM